MDEVNVVKEKHALVIGGTGMLTDVSLWLADSGYQVSVIGRTKEKHLDLFKKASNPQNINHLVVDYTNYALLEKQVRKAIEHLGPVSLVVSWTPIRKSLKTVNEIVSKQKDQWTLYQIQGSRRYFEKESLLVPVNCEHRSIYLGFIIEDNHSRWLTNQEISEGIIMNMKEDRIESIVGTLHPYAKRPS